MASISKQIAAALVRQLNAAAAAASSPFIVPFTAERKKLTDTKTIDAKLKVWVVAARQQSGLGRDLQANDHEIEIGILKKVSRETVDAETDELDELAEQLENFVCDHDLEDEEGDPLGVELTGTDISPKYDQARLQRESLFLAIVTCTYRHHRDQPEDDDE